MTTNAQRSASYWPCYFLTLISDSSNYHKIISSNKNRIEYIQHCAVLYRAVLLGAGSEPGQDDPAGESLMGSQEVPQSSAVNALLCQLWKTCFHLKPYSLRTLFYFMKVLFLQEISLNINYYKTYYFPIILVNI